MPARALFLDRDGIINIDVDYAHLPSQITWVDGIFELCRAAVQKNYLLIIITNQAGIGRGYYTEEQFHSLMQWMDAEFEKQGAKWTTYYFCPHHPNEGCACRKPMPGMLTRAQKEWDIDMSVSLLLGDKETDVVAGAAAGVKQCILLGRDAAGLVEVIALL